MSAMLKIVSLLFVLLTSGCASSGQQTLLGLGIGTLVGGAIGAVADAGRNGRYRTQNIFIGSTVGGIVAAATAFLIHPGDSKRAEMAEIAAKTNDLMRPKPSASAAVEHPVLVPPQVETRYMDDQVKGNTFVPGHLEFQIVKPSQWSRE